MHTCQFEAISQGNWPSLYTLCKADPLKACPITPLKDPYFMTTHLWGWRSILVKLTFDVGQSQKLGEKILNLDYPFTRRFSKKLQKLWSKWIVIQMFKLDKITFPTFRVILATFWHCIGYICITTWLDIHLRGLLHDGKMTLSDGFKIKHVLIPLAKKCCYHTPIHLHMV